MAIGLKVGFKSLRVGFEIKTTLKSCQSIYFIFFRFVLYILTHTQTVTADNTMTDRKKYFRSQKIISDFTHTEIVCGGFFSNQKRNWFQSFSFSKAWNQNTNHYL